MKRSTSMVGIGIPYAILLVSFCLAACNSGSAADAPPPSEARWWPVQKVPARLVQIDPSTFASPATSYAMTAQSVAGLAAKAVNEGRGAEMIWVGGGNPNDDKWLANLLQRHPRLKEIRRVPLWDQIADLTKKGIIKGYILYKADDSNGEINEHRRGTNCSVNVATSLSGILDGIVVDEQVEREAKSHGLAKLIDVRDKSQSWCFENYRGKFNRRMVCTQDPRKSQVRDLAIAQKAFTVYGHDEPTPDVMKWLEPLSPILGWNGGDEFKTTELSSRWGHLQTSTDWCNNLPVLMAGSESIDQPKLPEFDPRTIDWNDNRSAVSFASTDGDNVQWLQGNFFNGGDGASYWGNPSRGKIPFGWSCCFTQLSQLCPGAIDYAIATRSPNDSLIEWGGGYYYPELFGASRGNRWELLAEQAHRTGELMKKNGTRIIGFNFANYESPDARKAYEVLARETDGLLAILVFQYSPYEAGAGETFWVKDRNGIELPAITARYSIWEHSNSRERAGTPAKVAREIEQTVSRTPKDKLPQYDWVIGHVWSYFKESPGTDEDAENMPQANAPSNNGVRGYTPAVWCADRLPAEIRVVSPEELVWRIRMKHNPTQTKQAIGQPK